MVALVIAEHDNAGVRGATLNTVAAALQCGGEVHVLVAGHNAAGAAQGAAQIVGVAKVLHAEAPGFEHGLAENVAAQVMALAGNYSHIVFPATAAGKNVAPRVAALLDVAQISDATKVISPDTFERPIYAGNAIATVQSTDATRVITVRTTGFDAATATGGSAAVERITAVADLGMSSFLGSEIAKSDRPELTAARIVVSGGRAMGSGEKFNEVLTPLADKLGAALGASRAAVDAGYAPNDWQVGQTGKIVAPTLYIACGISGAIQHLAGMKDSKVIVAINKDPEAPIFSVADYGLEADLFAAVPEMVRPCEARSGALRRLDRRSLQRRIGGAVRAHRLSGGIARAGVVLRPAQARDTPVGRHRVAGVDLPRPARGFQRQRYLAQLHDQRLDGRGAHRRQHLHQVRARLHTAQPLLDLPVPAAADAQAHHPREAGRGSAAVEVRRMVGRGHRVAHDKIAVDRQPHPHLVHRITGRAQRADGDLEVEGLAVREMALDVEQAIVAGEAAHVDAALVESAAGSGRGQRHGSADAALRG